MTRPTRGNINRYQMRQKMVSIGDDFWIENEHGEEVFKVDGKALRIKDTLIFEDQQGLELCRIEERLLKIRDTMDIDTPDGKRMATIKKKLISPFRDRWDIEITDGPDLNVKGNILDHEYEIRDGRTEVARISKKWFHMRDTYGVEITPGQNDVLILAVTVALDNMAHSGK
jgi:uncharacterized protein YxjI